MKKQMREKERGGERKTYEREKECKKEIVK